MGGSGSDSSPAQNMKMAYESTKLYCTDRNMLHGPRGPSSTLATKCMRHELRRCSARMLFPGRSQVSKAKVKTDVSIVAMEIITSAWRV
eukprot:6209265-Pleurochrysis_carterae.AAC.4